MNPRGSDQFLNTLSYAWFNKKKKKKTNLESPTKPNCSDTFHPLLWWEMLTASLGARPTPLGPLCISLGDLCDGTVWDPGCGTYPRLFTAPGPNSGFPGQISILCKLPPLGAECPHRLPPGPPPPRRAHTSCLCLRLHTAPGAAHPASNLRGPRP